jgi:hypothetical protein
MRKHEQPVEPEEPVEDLELTAEHAEPVTGGYRHDMLLKLETID